jgi:hypothetical protein
MPSDYETHAGATLARLRDLHERLGDDGLSRRDRDRLRRLLRKIERRTMKELERLRDLREELTRAHANIEVQIGVVTLLLAECKDGARHRRPQ